MQDGYQNLKTWKIQYEHASYNPAPPFILSLPNLYAYVTKAFLPNMSVEQFNKYRDHMRKKYKNRSTESDLSVQVVGDPQAEFPTLLTKITLPFMFARRAMINTYYSKYIERSKTTIAVNSSIMNE